jgi:hypothetical protein
MRLPVSADPDRVRLQANELNAAEAQGDPPTALLGAWCPDPNSNTTLAFCSFVPNAIVSWVRVENLVSYQASRSKFAAEWLAHSY